MCVCMCVRRKGESRRRQPPGSQPDGGAPRAATRRTSGHPCRCGSTRSHSASTSPAGTGAAGTSCACILLWAKDTGIVLAGGHPHTTGQKAQRSEVAAVVTKHRVHQGHGPCVTLSAPTSELRFRDKRFMFQRQGPGLL